MVGYFISKMSLFRKSTGIAIQDMQTMVIHRQVQKTKERSIPLGRKRGIWEGLFRMQIHWRRTRVQGGEVSWAELQGWWISCRRSNVHLSLWGVCNWQFFPPTLFLLEPVIDTSRIPRPHASLPAPDSIWMSFPFINFLARAQILLHPVLHPQCLILVCSQQMLN